MAEQLRAEAGARGSSTSALGEQLIDEGLRMRRHPLVGFGDGPAGRRVARAVELFGLRREQVEAALAYDADFTVEIDSEVAAHATAAEEAEARWRRRQDLLAG